MDTDLEEMAIKVAERQNVSNPNGKIALNTIGLYGELSSFIFILEQLFSFK